MNKERPIPGQRWLSDTESELGLGTIVEVDSGRVKIHFPAASEHRLYALGTAPLRRIRFAVGDKVRLRDGTDLLISGVRDQRGLLIYEDETRSISETDLSDSMDLGTPWDRLMGGRMDSSRAFEMRRGTLQWRHAIRSSPVRGFVGARVDRIPHQLHIAREVASRLSPRVLLADEVGLGKTIEAGLILHRLHLTGRAGRVLVLVPEPLVHQWFVEMFRRFNLLFSIFDEERCEAISAGDPDANPFLDSQLVLCGVSLLESKPDLAMSAIAGEWDLVIVDEAHHLEWSEQAASPAYQIVEQIALQAGGLLLLTATPRQLGEAGHFARLRLLDPERYPSLETFLEESRHYTQVAEAVDRLLSGKAPSARDAKLFAARSPRIRSLVQALDDGSKEARSALVAALIDEFGVGRSLFRNRRLHMKGCPQRKVSLVELPAGDLEREKIKWLVTLLKKLKSEKILLICRSRELAESIHERLQKFIQVKCALFHEGLSLLNRDRNAAFFSEEDGARILICSEIGSEGRNFQFAHHLVLFDLPENPDLLEQRIGRLDRIGQTQTIKIHVPFQKRTRSEILARWFHEGLNAFEKTPQGASLLMQEFQEKLDALFEEPDENDLANLIKETRTRHREVGATLAKGNDRLLELNSCKPEQAAATIAKIREIDADRNFETFFIRLLDDFGLHLEELAPRRWLIQTGHLRSDAFPALPAEGMSATFDHAEALRRDDLDFLSIDHPLVRGAMDLLLGSDTGNAAFAEWIAPGEMAVFLEVVSVVECVAPAPLHVDRFLAPLPLRVAVDHRLQDCGEEAVPENAALIEADIRPLLDKAAFRLELLPAMLEAADKLAGVKAKVCLEAALQNMEKQLQSEIDRLKDLRSLNGQIRPEEIETLESHQTQLREALQGARPKIDAVRLILRKPGNTK